jgi:acetolactate synthase-1/2/3 large subunit
MMFYPFTNGARKHEVMTLTGGSIGQGLPVALGAAVACPDQKVLCLHGDGGAMYTVQSLWTAVRENLDITFVIYNNSSYAILNLEFMRVGAEGNGEKALSLLDLNNPGINWVDIAKGQGMKATRAETVAEFSEQFAAAMEQTGPVLIEAMVEPLNFG